MDAWVIAVIVVVALVLIAAAVLVALRRRRSGTVLTVRDAHRGASPAEGGRGEAAS